MAENHQSARFPPPVQYRIRFPEPATHYLTVEARFRAEGQTEIELFLPVWTPGSYLIREYARNIEPISRHVHFAKTRKNRWLLEINENKEFLFEYRVYCREMSVRTNWVEDSFALINGAPTFVASDRFLDSPHEIHIELPPRWTSAITGLAETGPGCYRAEDYHALIDSPILCGNPAVYRFEVDDIPHLLANEGEYKVWDGRRACADTEKLVRRHNEMWGSLPYRKYVFLNLMTEASGVSNIATRPV